MTAGQLIARIRKGAPPPAILLIGPEGYQRRRIKEALFATVPSEAVSQHDLSQMCLAEVLDDARSLSLFAAERVIWALNAEAALPRTKSEEDSDPETGPAASGGAAHLNSYLKDPTPGVVLVFEASRFDFEGDDKRRQERVRKFYAAIPDVVELHRFTPQEARAEAESLAQAGKFRMEPGALDLLVEALGADMARIAMEIEKLSLFASGRAVSADDIAALVPDARVTTVFALVNALGRRDRQRALEILDTLIREGEYLPLALAFLSTQFRLALAAREAGLKSSQQIVGHFTRAGIPMWSSRSDQVYQTVTRFSPAQLQRAIQLIFEADRGLRDARPDDRILMERFVLQLTA
jgi:DNA polymerase III subunit delta